MNKLIGQTADVLYWLTFAWAIIIPLGGIRVGYLANVDPSRLTKLAQDRLKIVPLRYGVLEVAASLAVLTLILFLTREGGQSRVHLFWALPAALVLFALIAKGTERLAKVYPVSTKDFPRPMVRTPSSGARYLAAAGLYALTGIAGAVGWTAPAFPMQATLCAVALGLGFSATRVVFGDEVAGAVTAALLSGAAIIGGIALLTLESVVSQVTGGVLAYSAWLGFSGSVFGAPIFILPFPPFIIFAWRELDEQTHVQIRHRWLALAVLAAVIMLFRYALSGFRALGV